MNRRSDRRGTAPRLLVILLLLAVLAVGGLWLGHSRQDIDYTLGGPLFPVDPAQIEGLLLTRSGLQYRFDRQADGSWSLSGAASDYLDTSAMTALVGVLPTAPGGAVLPGTETEDRRYDFNGPEAMRLRVFLTDGRNITLAMGALNPVTGNYFASGAGREGCFPVAGALRDKLFMLPTTVQARRLLPAFARDKVQRVLLTRSGTVHEFVRSDGQWWLRLPTTDRTTAFRGFPRLIQDYQARYDDRRRQDRNGLWILASQQAVGQMIYEVSETVVREIKNPREAASRLGQWELDPPWRRVVLQGPGLNPDPGAPVSDQFTIVFGPPVSEDQVPALRRGNVLLTDFAAVNLLEKGLDVLLEQFALNEVARRADRLVVQREGTRLLAAARTGVARTDEGRSAWQTSFPGPGTPTLDETNRHGLSQDLVVNLNRVEILAVLPPTTDSAVLQVRERVRITLNWDSPASLRELVLETGFLALEHLPSGADGLIVAVDGSRPVGLWFPSTGKLLQIPDHLVVTVRNMVSYAAAATAP